MVYGILGLILLACVFGPQYWVKHVINKYSKPRDDFPGSGGELAEHLIETYGIDGAKVETTDKGDHYDPQDKYVRLLDQHYNGRSIAAVAIAAHEVGHAIQDHRGEKLLKLRVSLARILSVTDMLASAFFILAPILTVFVRSPAALFGLVAIGIGFLAIRLFVHLITLPVEWDASFGKALPILEQGGYLHEDDLPAARSVLRAAAMTYVASALASLLDITRWIRMIR